MKRNTPISLVLLSTVALAACQLPLAFRDPNANPAYAQAPYAQGPYAQAPYGNGSVAPGAMQPNPQAGAQWGARPSPGTAPAFAQGNPAAQRQPVQANEQAPLMGWDGGVVDAPQEGEIRSVSGAGNHGLQESVEGRMHIIELYQAVLDERDQLLTEVHALQAALEKSQLELESSRTDGGTQSTRISALEEAKRALTKENLEMASRLTTAQVRRLEAEKLLLETQIAWHRERGTDGPARTVSSENP